MSYFIDFITGISPSIAVILAASLSPWISTLNEKRKNRNTVLKERYNKLYLPFINEIMKFNYRTNELILSANIRNQFLDILLPNIEYMDKSSFIFLSELYSTHIDLISFEKLSYDEKRKQSDIYNKSIELYSKMFAQTTKSMLKESSIISKRLSMPDIASIVEFH